MLWKIKTYHLESIYRPGRWLTTLQKGGEKKPAIMFKRSKWRIHLLNCHPVEAGYYHKYISWSLMCSLKASSSFVVAKEPLSQVMLFGMTLKNKLLRNTLTRCRLLGMIFLVSITKQNQRVELFKLRAMSGRCPNRRTRGDYTIFLHSDVNKDAFKHG